MASKGPPSPSATSRQGLTAINDIRSRCTDCTQSKSLHIVPFKVLGRDKNRRKGGEMAKSPSSKVALVDPMETLEATPLKPPGYSEEQEPLE